MATKKKTPSMHYNDHNWHRDSLRDLLHNLESKLVLFDHMAGGFHDETSAILVADCANYSQKIAEALYQIQERVNVIMLQKIEQLVQENE